MPEDPSSPEFFEAKYRQNPDPWNFAGSEYELGRYAAIIRLLEGRCYDRAFEPGCSVGILTGKLAPLCRSLKAIDSSATAAAGAAWRCAALPQVQVRQGALPADLPAGPFDLIAFCEIGYYFDRHTLALLASVLVERLAPEGVLLAEHWLGSSPDHKLSGDEVHAILSALPLRILHSQRHPGFRIDQWCKA